MNSWDYEDGFNYIYFLKGKQDLSDERIAHYTSFSVDGWADLEII